MKIIARTFIVGLTCLLITGCDRATTPNQSVQKTKPRIAGPIEVVFLTREGCTGSTTLLANLKKVANILETPVNYEVIDQGSLPLFDPRSGYPTPTILYKNRDLFGMSEPSPPFPEPM